MKFRIEHDIKGRMRIHVLQKSMTYRQADILFYYLHSLEFVNSAKVYELTADAAIDHAEGVAKIHDPDLLLCVHACSSSRISLPCRALCASGAERTLQAFGPLRYFRRRCCSFRRAAAQSSARQMRRRRHAAF